MSDFDLDLRNAESYLDAEDVEGSVVLGVLDGSTPDDRYVADIEAGNVLVLAVEGDMNKLAAGFARDVKDLGGQLMHFRKFLVITPPGVDINTDRLS